MRNASPASVMNEDATFQTALIVGFVVVVGIVLFHRIKAHAAGDKLDRRQEGVFVLVALRLTGLVVWSSVIAYMVNPSSMAWSSLALPDVLRWLGVGLCAAVAALLLWTLRSLGPNLTDTVVTRRAHTLVMHGPYRWVRHPFYDCVALLILSFALMAANWFILVGGALFILLAVVRTRIEEMKLVERFGEDYRAYMARTGRFFPRLGGGARE